MVTTVCAGPPPQGQSLKNPPYFDGKDFNHWKARMQVFIQAMDYELWNVIVNGPIRKVEKGREEWGGNDDKKNINQLNAKATHVLYCGLDKKSFSIVYTCESAKDIWDKLEEIYGGSSQVKQYKINKLECDYDFFEMKPEESVIDMFSRLRHIINELHFLGRTYTDEELVQKILRTLPNGWELIKVIAMMQRDNSASLSPEGLLGSLMEYEPVIMRKKEMEKKNGAALKNPKDEKTSEADEAEVLAGEFLSFCEREKKMKSGRKKNKE